MCCKTEDVLGSKHGKESASCFVASVLIQRASCDYRWVALYVGEVIRGVAMAIVRLFDSRRTSG